MPTAHIPLMVIDINLYINIDISQSNEDIDAYTFVANFLRLIQFSAQAKANQ